MDKFMALYYYLPVYKASYDLLLTIFQLTKNFSREYKYTIGQDLKKLATEMVLNIYRANSKADKQNIIQNARENIEVIRLYIRLLKDLKQININKLAQINMLIESASKQLVGWHNSSR
ncbi:MAG: four helix bundle protein [Patescibacteria group bacterium]|nr:four helix bundle protein [Patescibacteria group bacterium]